MMQPDELDLAGFCVALSRAPRADLRRPRRSAGDAIIALPSSGPHSNGFSLIRRLLERAETDLDSTPAELGGAICRRRAAGADPHLRARRCSELTRTVDVRGMAHITGGGIPGNLTRQFPEGARRRGRPELVDAAGGVRLAGRRWGSKRTRCARCSTSAWASRRWSSQKSVDTALTALERGGCPGLVAAGTVAERGGGAALRIGVLISGNGTNLQALIDAGDIEIACVVSSRPDAPGHRSAPSGPRCRCSPPPTSTIPRRSWTQHEVELVVLAGYMRSSRRASSRRFPRGIINVHPSLLPAFPGAHCHRRCVWPTASASPASPCTGGRRHRHRPHPAAGGA